jgi:hypothetical protein
MAPAAAVENGLRLPDVQGPKWLLAWQARKYLEARIGPLKKTKQGKERDCRQGNLRFER